MNPLKKQLAFTLLEILVVLVVFALVGALVVQSTDWGSPRAKAKQSAERFLTAFQFAQDKALLEEETLGVAIQSNRYYFLRYDTVKKNWQPLAASKLLGEMSLPEGIHFNVQHSGVSKESAADIIINPSVLSSPFSLVISGADAPYYEITNQTGSIAYHALGES